LRKFNVLELKTIYIKGDLDTFCIIIGMDINEFNKLNDNDQINIWDHEIELLKAAKIFQEWI
jgi:hypothetical protein